MRRLERCSKCPHTGETVHPVADTVDKQESSVLEEMKLPICMGEYDPDCPACAPDHAQGEK